MRILVTSDSHGNFRNLRQAVLAQPSAQLIMHLGDGADDLEDVRLEFPERQFLQVRGNNDWSSALPLEGEITLQQTKIFYTHGHKYNVKYGLYDLAQEARRRQADVVLFGHTHVPYADYDDGLYLMNPGSLSTYDGSYGLLDLTPQGIVTNIIPI